MKRRRFIQNASLGTSGLIVSINRMKLDKSPARVPEIPVLEKITKLEDALNEKGQIMVRIEFFGTSLNGRSEYESKIRVKKAGISRMRSYFFENYEDSLDEKKQVFNGVAGLGVSDIIVLWIDNPIPESRVMISAGNNCEFSLGDLIRKQEINFKDENDNINVNYLLDREIGKIDLKDLGVKIPGNDFSFVLMADPQGGDSFLNGTSNTRMRIHNTWVDESIRLVNELEPEPLFTLMVGDIVDGQGPEEYFLAMETLFSKLQTPILYEIGNHESRYSASFEPGYNHESLRNYYEAQMRVNGMDKLLYSFDLGQWHFIIWPDPLRSRFWERHPHYFDWLEEDLEKHREMPTMVYHHVPAHPIGIDPLTEYAESPYVKRTFTDILSRYGNVKYVFSGHVHIPLRASIKTAVEYKGMKFINLPAAGYRPRGFGEEDLFGGPSQGIAIVKIKGKEGSVDFKNVMNDIYSYADSFRKFDDEEFPFWYHFRWELPKNEHLMNGDFSEGLDHWKKRYVYLEDKDPTNIREVRQKPGSQGEKALYLFSDKRGFDTAGQDRLAQTLNRVAQVIDVDPGKQLNLSLEYLAEEGNFNPENRSSFYIWIEGYEKSTKRLNMTYSPGYHYFPLERNYSQHSLVDPMRMELPATPGKWYKLFINSWKDFRETTELEKVFLDKIDRFIVNLGVWTINDGYQQKTGVYFANVKLENSDHGNNTPSTSNGKALAKKDNRFMVWGGADHVAGEHIAWRSDMNFYRKGD